VTRSGRPPGPLSPEYSEVLRLYDGTRGAAEIGEALGLPRSRVDVIVQDLRRRGAIAAQVRAPRTGRRPAVAGGISVEVTVPAGELEMATATGEGSGAGG
jgi:cell division inhibitor SulA